MFLWHLLAPPDCKVSRPRRQCASYSYPDYQGVWCLTVPGTSLNTCTLL